MKKKVLMIAAILCMAFVTPVFAGQEGEQVDLQVSIDDPDSQKGGPRKAPPRPPPCKFPWYFSMGTRCISTSRAVAVRFSLSMRTRKSSIPSCFPTERRNGNCPNWFRASTNSKSFAENTASGDGLNCNISLLGNR